MRKLNTEELGRLSIEEFRISKRVPIIVVLDNVRSGHNAGSVFRTCDAFGLLAIYLCGITPFPPNREVMKTALGSAESMDWLFYPETKDALKELRDNGFEIILAEHTTESIALQDFLPSREKKYALVFGNEVDGIQNELLAMADGAIEIPQFGTKHSLNISVAAGIILWDFFCKMRR